MNFSLLHSTFHTKIVFFWEKLRQTIKRIWKFTIVSNSSSLSVFFKLAWNTKPPVCFDWPLPDTISWVSCQQLKFNEGFNLFSSNPQTAPLSLRTTLIASLSLRPATLLSNSALQFVCASSVGYSLFSSTHSYEFYTSSHTVPGVLEHPFLYGVLGNRNASLGTAIHDTASKGYDHRSSHLDITSSLQFPNTPNWNIVSPYKNFYSIFLWQILSR